MESIVRQIEDYVKQLMHGEETGHDWYHVRRVLINARNIGKHENAEMKIVELGALLHDIADHKFHGGDNSAGPRAARKFLESIGAEESVINRVCDIVGSVSYSAGIVPCTIEGKVVQDADRLDAIGAIGLARVFAYGGKAGREIYNPGHKKHSIQHFYDKLLKIKDKMNTETGRKLAEERHRFILNFLEQFYREWNI